MKSLEALVNKRHFDVVMTGVGLRGLMDHTLLFEDVVNVIHRHSPSTAASFNSHPTNAVDAVLRHI